MTDEPEKTPAEREIDALLKEAEEMEHGPGRIGVVEAAVAKADADGLERMAYDARLELVQSAIFGGYPEKGFVAFGWIAAKSKQEPERFKESKALLGMFLTGVDVLWAYKWMSLQVPWYPQVSLEQIRETLADMEERYTKHGLSLRPLHMAWVRVEIETGGDPDVAHEHYRKWQWASRDIYADCQACEVSFRAYFHAHRGELEQALKVAAPLLDGEMSCAEVPHNTYARLLDVALRLDRKDDAARYHEIGYPMVRDNRDFVWPVSRHIDYLVRTGALDRAQELVQRHLPWVVDNRIADRKMWFYAATRDLFRQLSAPSTVRFPESLAIRGETDPAKLADFFAQQVSAIAQRFDARNGNDFVSKRVGA